MQKILLSATLTRNVDKLAQLGLWRPLLVQVKGRGGTSAHTDALTATATATPAAHAHSQSQAPLYTLPATLTHRSVLVPDPTARPLYLLHFVFGGGSATGPHHKRILVFCKSRDEAKRLGRLVEVVAEEYAGEVERAAGAATGTEEKVPVAVKVDVVTSEVRAGERKRALREFGKVPGLGGGPGGEGGAGEMDDESDGEQDEHPASTTAPSSRPSTAHSSSASDRVHVLVTTDLPSRGLSLPPALSPLVISYTPPSSLQTHVHRIGRTARAGHVGKAYTLVAAGGEWGMWGEVCRKGGVKVDRERIKVGGLEKCYERALRRLEREVKGRREGGKDEKGGKGRGGQGLDQGEGEDKHGDEMEVEEEEKEGKGEDDEGDSSDEDEDDEDDDGGSGEDDLMDVDVDVQGSREVDTDSEDSDSDSNSDSSDSDSDNEPTLAPKRKGKILQRTSTGTSSRTIGPDTSKSHSPPRKPAPTTTTTTTTVARAADNFDDNNTPEMKEAIAQLLAVVGGM
ncbi:ATP-dependent RNA helicase ddx51 [Gonapodya sp. JEL0774]|nr:ATP-dependent RNA helicase ddx51 [Gonapodya sp. JEL0774]